VGTIRVLDREHLRRCQLKIDARLRLMAVFAPARYGRDAAG
jgi:hypothetical protein